mmetsp:Transcript_18384/g.59813  ORF Transcript_18384/g.59813 Transcript_18384/m.59813 type:complete len:234 (-) Transcript_18384:250-951(-)
MPPRTRSSSDGRVGSSEAVTDLGSDVGSKCWCCGCCWRCSWAPRICCASAAVSEPLRLLPLPRRFGVTSNAMLRTSCGVTLVCCSLLEPEEEARRLRTLSPHSSSDDSDSALVAALHFPKTARAWRHGGKDMPSSRNDRCICSQRSVASCASISGRPTKAAGTSRKSVSYCSVARPSSNCARNNGSTTMTVLSGGPSSAAVEPGPATTTKLWCTIKCFSAGEDVAAWATSPPR